MALKKGLDQLSAWILAVVAAGAFYGTCYGVMAVVAKHSHDPDEGSGDEHDGGEAGERDGGAKSHEGAEHEGAEHEGAEHGEEGKHDGEAKNHESAEHEHEGAEHGEAKEHDGAEHGEAGKHKHGEAGKHEHGEANDREGTEHKNGEAGEHEGSTKHKTESNDESQSQDAHDSNDHADTTHWDYKGSLGPDHWGSLSETYKTCQTGRQQSPVDIDGPASNAKLLPIRFHYKEGDGLVKNDGHTIAAKMQTGSYVEIDGDRYDLAEIRFHAPGEHKVASAAYDFEMHLIHKDPEGHVAVLAVLFEESSPNKALAKLWKNLPGPGESLPEPIPIDPEAYLPTRRLYYSYPGSLTVPPCTEGVKWFVFTDPVSISAKQVDEFSRVVPFNARPVQALHTRKVVKSTRS